MKVNVDRILPTMAPVVGRLMTRSKAARNALFEALPPAPGRVLFLGDSITAGGTWEGWFPELQTTNRGVGGDVIAGVLSRLETAIDSPTAISLMIGTNDLSGLGRSREVSEIATQLDELVTRIQQMAPDAPLLLNSVLPRSSHFADRITRLNDRYRRIAERAAVTYVDLWPVMAGPDGELRGEFTIEGLHLTPAGYRQWVDVLRPHLHDALESVAGSSN